MSYDHILVPTDFSELSNRAVDVAKHLAALFSSRLTLVHNCDVLPPPYPPGLWPPGDLGAQLEAAAMRSLETVRGERLGDSERVELRSFAHPNTAVGIADYAGDNAADLIVLTTHGRTGLAHFFIGSVAEGVVRYAPCPVLVVRPPVELPRFPRDLLVCTDFSPASVPALEAASDLVRTLDARVTLLHVYVDTPLAKRYLDPLHVDVEVRKALDELERKHFANGIATVFLVASNAADAIASYALRHASDLVVVASHGRTGLGRLLMGSVAERVVRHAPCSVLVARSR